MNIVLTGMRGSGKSTVGKLLAEKLQKDFFETDNLIENAVKTNISDFVTKNGWEAFRKIEKLMVKIVHQEKNCVISTGGGVILDSENISLLKKNGKIIFLKCSLTRLFERLKDNTDRPLLTDEKTFADDLKKTYELRKELYEDTADYVVNTEEKSELEIVKEIIKLNYDKR